MAAHIPLLLEAMVALVVTTPYMKVVSLKYKIVCFKKYFSCKNLNYLAASFGYNIRIYIHNLNN